jgi:hypothetical protein
MEENRAELELIEGNLDEAQWSIARALSIAEQRGDAARRAAALKLKGTHERLSGNPLGAQHTLSHALTLSAVAEDALLGAELLFQFGTAAWSFGDEDMGREVLSTALEAFERIGARQWAGRVRSRLTSGDLSRYF